MSVLSDLQRSAELNRDAFAACRRALTMAEKALKLAPAKSWWDGDEDQAAYRAIKAARTSMAKAERGVSRD